jgi:hypothetical protein
MGVVDGKYYKGGITMLYVALYCPKPSATPLESITRRMEFKPPEGIKMVAEYWLQHNNPHIIVVFEADNYAPIMAMNAKWTDIYDCTVVTAITGEEGLKLASQMMPKT